MVEPAAELPDALIRRARNGSEAALGPLLELYRGYLRLLARLKIPQGLQGKWDPSDAVQETFLRAQRGFREFQGQSEAELIAWLRKILARAISSHCRHFAGTQKRNPSLERDLMRGMDQTSGRLDMAIASPINSPSQLASRREEAVLVADAIERLPADYRDIILLRNFEQLTFPAIAEKTGRSLDSVKNLWARALAQLRREMST